VLARSPRLIAGSYVLHRLLLPRHSPYALTYFTKPKTLLIIEMMRQTGTSPLDLVSHSYTKMSKNFRKLHWAYAQGRTLKIRQKCLNDWAYLGCPADRNQRIGLLKEVIQPQVPLRLPCYDFTPIANLTVGAPYHKGSGHDFGCGQLSWCDGRCVQDPGTYSPQHADLRLLAIPTS
jgi:hypothetical protein